MFCNLKIGFQFFRYNCKHILSNKYEYLLLAFRDLPSSLSFTRGIRVHAQLVGCEQICRSPKGISSRLSLVWVKFSEPHICGLGASNPTGTHLDIIFVKETPIWVECHFYDETSYNFNIFPIIYINESKILSIPFLPMTSWYNLGSVNVYMWTEWLLCTIGYLTTFFKSS